MISCPLLLRCACLVAILCVVTADDCLHPLFIKNGVPVRIPIMYNTALTLAPQPVAVDDTNRVTCSNIGRTSCCTAVTIRQINALWANYTAQFDSVQKVLPYATGDSIGLLLFGPAYPFFPSSARQALRDAVNAAKAMNGDAVPCSYGMSAYFQGLACSACDAAYGAYIVNGSRPDAPLLRLQQETCDNAYSQCSAFIGNSLGPNGNLTKIVTAAIAFCTAVPAQCLYQGVSITPSLTIIQTALATLPSCSGATCKTLFCSEAFRGLDYTGDLTAALYSLNGAVNARESLHLFVAILMNVMSSANVRQSIGFGPGYADVSFLPNGAANAFAAVTVGCKTFYTEQPVSSCPAAGGVSSGASRYSSSSSGRAAASTGQQSQSDTALSGIVIAVIVLIVVVAVVVAVVGICAAYYFYTKSQANANASRTNSDSGVSNSATAFVRLN